MQGCTRWQRLYLKDAGMERRRREGTRLGEIKKAKRERERGAGREREIQNTVRRKQKEAVSR